MATHTKFLGVMLRENLTWNEHLKVLLSKINQNFGVVHKLSYTLPSCIITKLYNALILPYTDYCNIVWATHPSTLLDKLYRIQRKSVRILTNSDRKAHAAPLFQQVGILKVYDINKLQISCFVYKAMHYLLSPCFKDYFVLIHQFIIIICEIMLMSNDITRERMLDFIV